MRSFDPYTVSLYDETDLAPYEWNDCAQRGCNVSVRNAQFCKLHDRVGRIRDRIKGMELRQGLHLGLYLTSGNEGHMSLAKAAARMLPVWFRAEAMADGRAPRARRAPMVGAAVSQ